MVKVVSTIYLQVSTFKKEIKKTKMKKTMPMIMIMAMTMSL